MVVVRGVSEAWEAFGVASLPEEAYCKAVAVDFVDVVIEVRSKETPGKDSGSGRQ